MRVFTDGVYQGDSPLWLVLRKVFELQGLGLDFMRKVFIFTGLACKVLILDEKERGIDFDSIVEADLIIGG